MIALVVGHTTKTQGATNLRYKISEWQFNSILAGLVKQQLIQSGFEIPPVINDNLPHYKEHEPVNKLIGIKAAISFHLNAAEAPNINYCLVKYWHLSKKGKELALNVLESLDANNIRRGTMCNPPGALATKNTPDWTGRGASFLRKCIPTAILLEPAFITCDEWLEEYLTEGKLDPAKMDKFAWTITNGLVQFLKNNSEEQK